MGEGRTVESGLGVVGISPDPRSGAGEGNDRNRENDDDDDVKEER